MFLGQNVETTGRGKGFVTLGQLARFLLKRFRILLFSSVQGFQCSSQKPGDPYFLLWGLNGAQIATADTGSYVHLIGNGGEAGDSPKQAKAAAP